MAYMPDIKESFEYKITDGEIEIDYDFFDKDLVSKFINTLVDIVIDISKLESMDVILSGGVFQNKTLLELILKRLDETGIKCYYQQETPINDGGISLGQIYNLSDI
jgi:hydrogenase maturation protein HypF